MRATDSRYFALIAALGVAGVASAEESTELSSVVVTATRIAESSHDIAASVDRVEGATLQRGQLQVNLSESLLTVPGVSAQNR